MHTAHSTTTKSYPSGAISLAAALALTAALFYAMIALGVLPIGDLVNADETAGMMTIAAVCYLLGGLLLRIRLRWLWIVSAVLNGAATFSFFRLNLGSSEVLLTPGWFATTAAQMLLELVLVFLIAASFQRIRGPKSVKRLVFADPVS
ncbi:MAG: hypothetical protein EHM41_14450 [Chloroflexi bacterium]|nr:MAG: hypothetical protein EHM41_14450 [Chloroflexota bacterium]